MIAVSATLNVEAVHERDVDFRLVNLDNVARDRKAQLGIHIIPLPTPIVALVRPGLAIFIWAIYLATISMELIVIPKRA